MQNALKKTILSPLDFNLVSQNFLLLEVRNPDHQNFFSSLSYKLQKYAASFKGAKMILDFRALMPMENMKALKALLHGIKVHGFTVAAILGNTEQAQQFAASEKIAFFPEALRSFFDDAQTIALPNQVPKINPSDNPHSQPNDKKTAQDALIITEPVRSGKQIYARNTDLIILAPVSPGAEIIADGNIHIYASLKGKALAGFKGNKNACVFCADFQGELISIAGIYKTSESIGIEFAKKSIQVSLKEDALVVKLL